MITDGRKKDKQKERTFSSSKCACQGRKYLSKCDEMQAMLLDIWKK